MLAVASHEKGRRKSKPNLTDPNYLGDYMERTSIDLGLFGRWKMFGNWHLEGRIGYALGRNYEQYAADEKIDFAGGEVLYQKQFFPVLERLAQHPNAKNLYIFFHSNFNAPFDVNTLNDLLKPFGQTKIKISVDAGSMFRRVLSETLS